MPRTKAKQQEFILYVYYDLTLHSDNMDDRLDARASDFGGEVGGSGAGFGERDISYVFPSLKQARQFARAVKKWKNVRIDDKVTDVTDDKYENYDTFPNS